MWGNSMSYYNRAEYNIVQSAQFKEYITSWTIVPGMHGTALQL